MSEDSFAELWSNPVGPSLPALITWIDCECARDPDDVLPRLVLAQAVAALGRALLTNSPHERIAATTAAAEAYLGNPTEVTQDALFAAATNSYPFGPGEGCYAVSATGIEGCEPGSGCASGVGSLALSGLDPSEAIRVIAAAIAPPLSKPEDAGAEGH